MYGLYSLQYGQIFSLKSLTVECVIRNMAVSGSCEFVYRNDGNKVNADGLFSFPLEYDCVVYFFEALVDGKIICGECKEIPADKLNQATLTNKIPDSSSNRSIIDAFKCEIGNFPRNSEAKINLKFSLQLNLCQIQGYEGVDRCNLVLPFVLTPRKVALSHRDDRDVYQVSSQYEYNFKAVINGTKVIENVSSVNHTLDVVYDNDNKTSAKISMKSKYDGTKNLDIEIDYQAMNEPSVIYVVGSSSEFYLGKSIKGAFYQSDVVTLNFLPKFNENLMENRSKVEVVLVVDRSGSMNGSRIKRAKECLLIFLTSLPENCKFQIYGFGTEFDKTFTEPQIYSNESKKIARDYQQNITANMEGTELIHPLLDMYNSPLPSDYCRLAFVITDGEFGNEEEIINLARKHNKSTRLFLVLIGDEVATLVAHKVAQAGLGEYKFVQQEDNLSEEVIKLLDHATNSALFTNAKLDWLCPHHVSVTTTPKTIPPVFSDYFLTAFCMIKGMKSGDVIKCVLSGNVNGNPVSLSIEIRNTNPFVDNEFAEHRLVAKCKINEITEQIQSGNESMKNELIDLSLQTNIATHYTAIVAIDQGNLGQPLVSSILRDLPKTIYVSPRVIGKPPLVKMAQPPPIQPVQSRSIFGFLFEIIENYTQIFTSNRSISEEHQSRSEPEDVIIYLIDRQNIDGSWSFCESILLRIGVSVSEFRNKLVCDCPLCMSLKRIGLSDDALMTVIIYEYLTKNASQREKEWRLVGKKAKKWIDKNIPYNYVKGGSYFLG